MVPKLVCSCLLLGKAPGQLKEANDVDVVLYDGADECASREWLLENARGATAIIVTSRDKSDRELLQACGDQLKIVSTVSVGCAYRCCSA